MKKVESLFRNYQSASEYAKKVAMNSSTDSEISRRGDIWVVLAVDDAIDTINSYADEPEVEIRSPYISHEQIIESREKYRALIASKGLCYQCNGSGNGQHGHLCSICRGMGYVR